MLKLASALTVILALPAASSAQAPAATQPDAGRQSSPVVCKYVVSADEGAKPYKMCMTRAEWSAKKKADAKDPNRKICRYEQASGTRFRSHKICMTSAEWENQRQLERQAIDKMQATTCVHGGGC